MNAKKERRMRRALERLERPWRWRRLPAAEGEAARVVKAPHLPDERELREIAILRERLGLAEGER